MCLIINLYKHLTYQSDTARKDIPCYKVITKNSKGQWTSLFFKRKKWELNKLYTNTGKIDRGATTIYGGYYHSFANINDARCHAREFGGTVAKCIIPKGSQYFSGDCNHDGYGYASRKLKIVKICA